MLFRMIAAVGLSLLLLGPISLGHAQEPPRDPYRIGLKSRSFTPPEEVRLESVFEGAQGTRVHVMVQFRTLPTPGLKSALKNAGIELLNYVPNSTWFASVPTNLSPDDPVLSSVRWVGKILPEDKISSSVASIREQGRTADGEVLLVVKSFKDVQVDSLGAALEQHGATIIREIPIAKRVTISIAEESIPDLASEDVVRWIEPVPMAASAEAGVDELRVSIQADLARDDLQLSGDGVTVGVFEDFHADIFHPDFGGRVRIGEPDLICPAPWDCGAIRDTHTTGVAGIIGGAGPFERRGVAPEATVFTYAYPTGSDDPHYHDDFLDDLVHAVATRQIDVANNSWGSGGCSDSTRPEASPYAYGAYVGLSEDLDRAVVGEFGRPVSVVFSAGNERDGWTRKFVHLGETYYVEVHDCVANSSPPYLNYQTLNHPKSAKNIIVVGAIDSDNNKMSFYSSWGPTGDGRLKPELVAPGHHAGEEDSGMTNATDPDTHCFDAPASGGGYWCLAQTSAAAPAVSGSIALLLEDYRVQFPTRDDPLPSTVKALLIHSAQDLDDDETSWYNKGPDYASGYGLIQIKDAVELMRADTFLEGQLDNVEQKLYSFTVASGTTSAKVTLAWDDPPAAENAWRALVNDLNLILLDPSGAPHRPWILDPDNPSEPAVMTGGGTDTRNNVEQIVVENIDGLETGTWTIVVTGPWVAEGPQEFSLVASEPLASAASPPVLYVRRGGGLQNSGRSPSDALPDLWIALQYAQQAGGDEIRVANGWHAFNAQLWITEPGTELLIQGGWSDDFSTRSNDPSLTILDAELILPGNIFRIYAESGNLNVTIEGLTLQNGYTSQLGGDPRTRNGGAILAYALSSADLTLTLRNCRILNNYAAGFGGGVFLGAYDGGSLTALLENNTIAGNDAVLQGGGVAMYASDDDGSMTATLVNNVISDNAADGYGGGAWLHSDGGTLNVDLTNAWITGNSAALGGGGLHIGSNSRSTFATIANAHLFRNSATEGGGVAVYNVAPTILNSTFHDNTADKGGAVYNYGENATTVITNSIFWGDTSATGYEIDNEDGAIPVVTYCNVDGGHAGVGNINLVPGFVDAANGDLRLTEASPCIDTGNNDAPGLQASDLSGDSRLIDGDYDGLATVDMGAYEYRNLEAGSAHTPTGSPVEVEIDTSYTHPVTGEEEPLSVQVTYDQVIESGHTTVVPRYETVGQIPPEYKIGLEDYAAVFFDVYPPPSVQGPISVCASYPDSEEPLGTVDGTLDTSECDLEILHDEGGGFLPRTAAIGDATCPFAETTCSHNLCIDTVNNEICAKVTDTSPFIVAIRIAAPAPSPRAVTVGYGSLEVATGVPGVPSTITWSDRDVVLSGAFRDNVVNLGDNPFVTSPMSGSGWVSTPSGTPAGGAFGASITSPGFSFDVFGFYTCPDTVGVCTSNGPDDDGYIRYDGYFSEAVLQNLSGPIMGPSTGQLPRYGSLGEEIVYTMDASSDCVVMPPSTVADCSGNIVLNAYSPPLPNTPVGTDVEVDIETSFTHPDTGIDIPLDVGITYDEVTSEGSTTVIPWSSAPGDMSDNFSVAVGEWQSVFFDVSTDASVTGPIVICTGYPDANNDGYVDGSYADECRVRVLHREAGVYQDRTLTAADPRCPLDSSPSCEGMCIDAINNEICVGVDDLSMFTQVVLNEVPIADPGDDQVIYEIGTLVALDGSKSTDPDGDDPITFAWTLLEKPVTSQAELDDASSPTPTFIPDVYGDYRFELVVTDALDKSSQPEQVLVSFENVPPVADSGDNLAVRVGSEVWLDGLRSYDPNGDDPLSLFYLWRFVSTPEGSAAVIADPGAPVTSFVADMPGIYVVELLVNDGELTSEPSVADITATTAQSDLTVTLHYAVDVVNGLSPDDFTNPVLQKNMTKHLGQALALIDKGEYADARYKLEAEVHKTDGCAHEGMPDTNDWIDACIAQEQVHPLLVHALTLVDEILGG